MYALELLIRLHNYGSIFLQIKNYNKQPSHTLFHILDYDYTRLY